MESEWDVCENYKNKRYNHGDCIPVESKKTGVIEMGIVTPNGVCVVTKKKVDVQINNFEYIKQVA